MSEALDIGGIFRDFRNNWENTVVGALIALGIQSFAGIGILFIIIGIFFTLFYAYAVSAYLHGALYLSMLEKGGQAGDPVGYNVDSDHCRRGPDCRRQRLQRQEQSRERR